MNRRLEEIIRYKTNGKQNEFARLLGWSPQYLVKLLHGESFGLQPVLMIVGAIPELNARWLLTGDGDMLVPPERIERVKEYAVTTAESILELAKYIPIMNDEELTRFEQSVIRSEKPLFSPAERLSLSERLSTHEDEMNARFEAAQRKSQEICKHRKMKQ